MRLPHSTQSTIINTQVAARQGDGDERPSATFPFLAFNQFEVPNE